MESLVGLLDEITEVEERVSPESPVKVHCE